jgi:uncharacterized protein YbjT (DUF2867 family)
MSTYLVVCATGQQGRAVVKHLLAANCKVHAVVRDPLKETARQLENQGVVLFKGENNDFPVFHEAAKGCKGVCLNQPMLPQVHEVRGIVQACKEAEVETVVLSTAFFTGDKSKWDDAQSAKDGVRDYYAVKSEMETVVRDAGLKHYTILRPGWYHANYLLPNSKWYYPDLATSNELIHSYNPGVKVAHLDEEDIGKYAVAALLDPVKFNGEEIDLGNENLTVQEAVELLRKASGRDIKVRNRTSEEVAAAMTTVPTQTFQFWSRRVDVTIDGELLEKKYGIRMTTFEEYFEREKSRLLASLQV